MQSNSKTFILVHAQWHGSWCWNKLIPLMEEKGYKVIAPDLPGHGDDTTLTEDVTLEDCVQKVVTVATERTEKVILLGHSSSGMVIAQAGEILGRNKVAALVFLDAFLPNSGESCFSLAEKFGPAQLGASLIVSDDHKTVSLNPEKVEGLLYHDCSLTDITFAKSHIRPGPIAVLATPVSLTEANYDTVPKFYIRCTEAKDMDKTKLAGNVACKKMYTLPSSHSPFFSMPDKLTEILDEIYNE